VNGNDKEPSAPSGAVLAVWGKGDYDLEPSTKMLALVDLLKEADEHGDKTICFSQCMRCSLVHKRRLVLT